MCVVLFLYIFSYVVYLRSSLAFVHISISACIVRRQIVSLSSYVVHQASGPMNSPIVPRGAGEGGFPTQLAVDTYYCEGLCLTNTCNAIEEEGLVAENQARPIQE